MTLIGFRWQVENRELGTLNQFQFEATDGSRYILKNHELIESTKLDLLLKSLDPISMR
jgi:hypothetical protein